MIPAPYRERVIPIGAWFAAGIGFVMAVFFLSVVVTRHSSIEARVWFPLVLGTAIAADILLIGYVYGDAKRRGMRYVMWTLLAIFLTNGIGIILYFILREPLLGFCSRCGRPASPKFAFCPHCGSGLQQTCPSCHRVIEGPWSHCAWCGTPVGGRPVNYGPPPPADRPA
jgi:RNA polymerase subunit RPABC4/transcription elongation factor Spt4